MLGLGSHEPAALQAFGRPDFLDVVKFWDCLCAGRQHHPRLFGRRENVDVRRTQIRVVHGTDTHEPNGRPGLRVMAPDRDPTAWAAGDLLTFPACRWRQDQFGLIARMHDPIGLVERVERIRSASLTLAPAAMASVNNQRRSSEPVSDASACASAFHLCLHQRLNLWHTIDVGPAWLSRRNYSRVMRPAMRGQRGRRCRSLRPSDRAALSFHPIAVFTVSMSCLSVNGFGKKVKRSPSGRFLAKASSA